MKYLLMIYMNPTVWETLDDAARQEVFDGHERFIKMITESGEMVHTKALADASQTTTVRVRDGATIATDGPYLEAKEFLAGYYLVDTETKDRAIELAAMIPDAKYTAMEVRPLMEFGGEDV